MPSNGAKKMLTKHLTRLITPWLALRDAELQLAEVMKERASLKKLCQEMTETHEAELKRLDAFIVEDRSMIKKLRADKDNDLDVINALAEERDGLIGQIEALATQVYDWAGPPMEEVPYADEGNNVVVFSAKLKTRH